MNTKRLYCSLCILVIIGLNACDTPPPTIEVSLNELSSVTYDSAITSHHDDFGKVKVELSLGKLNDLIIVRGIFTPDEKGYHLYSHQLAKAGINGIGRPTLIEVSDNSKYKIIGKLAVNKKVETKDFPSLNAQFPVFPEGPITVYFPIELKEQNQNVITVALTYMSCSQELCNMPIEGAIVQIPIPDQFQVQQGGG